VRRKTTFVRKICTFNVDEIDSKISSKLYFFVFKPAVPNLGYSYPQGYVRNFKIKGMPDLDHFHKSLRLGYACYIEKGWEALI